MKESRKYKLKILFLITIISISVIVLIETFIIPDGDLYIYNTSQNVDYNVYVIPNEFINSTVIPKNNVYLQQIINYINVTFQYEYYASQKVNLDYIYNIKATLMIDYSTTNQNILKKEEYIIKDKTLTLDNSNKINVSETLNIDYQKYKNEALKFKEAFQIPVKAYIKLDFDIKTGIQIKPENQKVYEESNQELIIDLSQPVLKIEENKSQDLQKYIDEKGNYNNYIMFIFIFIIVVTFIYTLKTISKYSIETKGKYKLELNRLLRKYPEIIVELKEEIAIEVKYNVEVKDFYQLLNIEEEIREPILLYEKDEKKAIFCIIADDIKYIYILEDK